MIQAKIPGFKNLIAMRSHRELERHKSFPEHTGRGVLYPDEAQVQTKPELPRRVNFQSYRLPELRRVALDLGLNDQGQKKDLLARLEVADKAIFAEEMRVYQQNMLEYSANVDKMLLEPKKPHHRTFLAYTKNQLMGAAQRRGLSYEGSARDLLARLQAWDKPLYEDRKKLWKQARTEYLTMKARVAKFELF